VPDTSTIRPLRVAIAGLGAIGRQVAVALDAGLRGFELAAVSARDLKGASAFVATLRRPVPAVEIAALEPLADIVIESAPGAFLDAIAKPFLLKDKTVLVLSAGALLEASELIELARSGRGRIIVPSGAIGGLDAVSAAAEGSIHSARIVTRKPVAALLGAPYLVQNGLEVRGISEPLLIFAGPVREGAKAFPANVNVAAALSLAGIGPDRTMQEVWADPTLSCNRHQIEIDADSATLSLTIENIPSVNPKTGRIVAQSVLASLRRLAAPLRIGT